MQFKEGQRNLLKLDLLKLRTEKLEKVGEWTSTDGLNIMNHNAFHEFGTQNITLRVTTVGLSDAVCIIWSLDDSFA